MATAHSLSAEGNHDGDPHHEHQAHGHDHKHNEMKAGPNGGRIIHAGEHPFELFVREDRKLQITFLNNENEAIAPKAQKITAVTGERSNPTHITFEAENGILLSDKPVPEGDNLPIILNIKSTPDAPMERKRFMLNQNECPSCDYKEYACVCGH